MIIFIDESGDAGFKLNAGSSVVFVIALIIFTSDVDAEDTIVKIKALKREIYKFEDFEFKFNKCSKNLRIKYFQKIRYCKFRVRAVVVKKDKDYSGNSKEKFHEYVIKFVLKNSKNIANARIRLDGKSERTFKRNLTAYLRKALNQKNKKTLRDLQFKNSKSDLLIQLADMIAGAIHRYYSPQKTDSGSYLRIIKNRIEDIREL